jgi:hypothetical protein
MLTRLVTAALAAVIVGLCGCGGGSQPAFPDLHPVKGVVTRDGQPVKGGTVAFTPDPDRPEFRINSEVKADGTYTLSTVRTTDKAGERKAGAPAGKYRVQYMPPTGDQGAGGQPPPIDLPDPVTVKPGDNDIPISLPKR